MKVIKISIALVVIVVIALYIIRSLVIINKPIGISLPKNQFVERIEKGIDSVGKLPDSKFCKDTYDNVMFLIDDYYKPHPPQYPYGRLGNTQLENNQWKENLTKNLYSAYADKFIRQAFYVFRNKEWKIEDMQFIRIEFQTLRKSKLLEKGSPVDKKFMEIQTVISKYDEIAGFISACNGFSYSNYSLKDRFPIPDVQSKISRAETYLNNGLGNIYVNNCTLLHDGLKRIPKTLFRAHIHYLDNKVSQWSNMYSNYQSQSDYVNNLNQPLKIEIELLDNDIYKVDNFDSEYNKLLDKWSADNIKAYTYKYLKKTLN
jgi:hypothetical protein